MIEHEEANNTGSLLYTADSSSLIRADISPGNKLDLIDLPQVGDCLESFIHNDDKAAFLQNCSWVAKQSGASVTLNMRFRKGYEWWLVVNTTIEHEHTQSLRISLSVDHKASAIKSATQLGKLIEASGQGAVVIDAKGPVYANREYIKLLGYESIEDLMSAGMGDLTFSVHPADKQRVQKLVAAHMENEECPHTYDFRQIRKDGSTLWVEARTSRTQWDNRPATLSWIQDITKRKDAEHKIEKSAQDLDKARIVMEKANRTKSQFLAMMSHEFRTPLNGVIGMTEVLRLSSLTEKQHGMARVIESSGRNLLGILNNILDLSNLQSGYAEVVEEALDIEDTMASVMRSVSPVTKGTPVYLNTHIYPDVPDHIICDESKLLQILNNFIGNAIKFTHEGEICIRVYRDVSPGKPDRVRFEVTDTGIGIAEVTIDKLFNRFVQADSSSSRQFGGTGLGLAICKELSDLMGGKVGCNSIEHHGSTFWLSLPIQETKFEPLTLSAVGS